jgi:flavin-dependent dehydrogenase
MERFDAVVIGGGPGGSAAAWLLARAGWSVGLLERQAFPRRKVCGEYLSATNFPLLRRLGLAEEFRASAGPPVRSVGLFAGPRCLSAPLPRLPGDLDGWGRALSRERLDTLLLEQAIRAGVVVRQPATALALERHGDDYLCRGLCLTRRATFDWQAPVVIAAHGSWQPGRLPSQPPPRPARRADLFGFKAHFRDADLAAGLMPLLTFPGGYGGIVHCDGGRVSLSCCVRRDRLAALRAQSGAAAGPVVLGHIREACAGARRVLAGAQRCGAWLAAGPIRPGIRVGGPPGLFLVGNAAGEAHPVVAEGISMALQAAWLLTRRLTQWRQDGGRPADLARVGAAYAAAWRGHFAPRVLTAAAVAQWAMRPATVAWTVPLLERFPTALTWAARLSGKAARVVA